MSAKRATIEALVEKLESLREGDEAVEQLVARGPQAVAPLLRFLLEGRPGVTYRPRQRAVEALERLGAKDALIAYLRQKRDIPNPQTRLAEEAVEITAARALKRWAADADVVSLMLEILGTRLLPGAIDTLGEARRLEGIPHFVRALEDDVCRRSAEEALFKLGSYARPALLEAALTKSPSAYSESPSSVLRRRSALDLLSKMLLPRGEWRALRPCIHDRDPRIVVAAARLAAKPGCGNQEERAEAVTRLLAALPSADAFLQQEIQQCLAALVSQSREFKERRPDKD